MKAVVFAYSRRGCETARRILDLLDSEETRAYTIPRLVQPPFQPTGKPGLSFYGQMFAWADALIFVGSAGIAVREIAPHVTDKRTDPAVIVIDELGRFVIPLLSGHIGGANALAGKLAAALSATPVITTATDINGKFSVDAWAAKNGYTIDSMAAAKAVSAAILEGPVPMQSDFPIAGKLPEGVVTGSDGDVGILISWAIKNPFTCTLRLIPRVLHLGIGCRRGTSEAAIRTVVERTLSDYRIDCRGISYAATIDLKADEAGLLAFCRSMNWPIRFYSAAELQEAEGAFTASAFVQQVTGVDNVCERAALLGAETLIVRKTAANGVTVAVAAEHLEISFE